MHGERPSRVSDEELYRVPNVFWKEDVTSYSEMVRPRVVKQIAPFSCALVLR